MGKPIQLQQLGTQIYVTLRGFSDERYTGQVQFHITMNQGEIRVLNEILNAFEKATEVRGKLDSKGKRPTVASIT